MDIRVEYLSTSKTILFAGSELKYYLSKINNTISFSQDTEQSDSFLILNVLQMKMNTKLKSPI